MTPRGRAARQERRQFRELTKDLDLELELDAVADLGEPGRPPRHPAKDFLGAVVSLAIIGVFLLQITDALASRCGAAPGLRTGSAACSGLPAVAHHAKGVVTVSVGAFAALAALAFVWYMFWGYKTSAPVEGIRPTPGQEP
jgi:hypothetical protein